MDENQELLDDLLKESPPVNLADLLGDEEKVQQTLHELARVIISTYLESDQVTTVRVAPGYGEALKTAMTSAEVIQRLGEVSQIYLQLVERIQVVEVDGEQRVSVETLRERLLPAEVATVQRWAAENDLAKEFEKRGAIFLPTTAELRLLFLMDILLEMRSPRVQTVSRLPLAVR